MATRFLKHGVKLEDREANGLDVDEKLCNLCQLLFYRDAHERRPDDPDYDKRTLYLPDDFLANQTPAMRQWWEMKAKHFDIVLFFKVCVLWKSFHTVR